MTVIGRLQIRDTAGCNPALRAEEFCLVPQWPSGCGKQCGKLAKTRPLEFAGLSLHKIGWNFGNISAVRRERLR
jgi:hypothetical protein